ncbi:MAG: amidoligase family protein, partial [Eubacteriales bacterium]|nr:amidoligase family protein [Eubacteriales bacterium]
VEKIKQTKPKTMQELEDIWYEGYGGTRTTHYHQGRYHFLNLHSFFNGHHTVELRGYVQKSVMCS